MWYKLLWRSDNINYYNEIKNQIINNEITKKVKDYSKNRSDLETYYNVGKLIVEAQGGETRAKYGEGLIKDYSKKLIIELNDQKYSYRNLMNMRKYYLKFKSGKVNALRSQLSWSHYRELLSITDENEIEYFINLALNNNLSYRELGKRIKSNEYKRLPIKTKNKLMIEDKIEIKDLVPNPILIRNKNNIDIVTEKALHNLILENIESFMKELGNSFSFIGSEYKIKIGDRNHYIDLLLFNIKYNCYVVVELKITEFKVEYIAQVQKYMNYIDRNVKEINHNNTIGILICKKENKFVIEYCSDDRIAVREYELVWYNIYRNVVDSMDNYIGNSLTNPKFLFHGSPKRLEVIEQRQAHDSNGTKENEDYAVFMTSSFIIASAYAFKDKIKEMSEGLDWNFEIGRDADTGQIFVIMDNVNVDDELEGYIYVFDYDDSYTHEGRSIQYKCHKNVVPIDLVSIKFKDFKKYYSINIDKHNKTL